MHRKPFPKEAAALVRAYLAEQGIELSQPRALEIVARVEGFQNWNAMFAKTRQDAAARQAQAPKTTRYEQWWKSLLPVVAHKMSGLCFVVRGNVKPTLRVLDPGEAHDDESHVSFIAERINSGDTKLWFKLALVENEQDAGEFALRLSVTGEVGEELLTWTSGPRYTEDLWCSDLEELRTRLRDEFQPGDILLSLYETAGKKFLKPR